MRQWKALREELHKEYPKSVFMLRSRMKEVLGFSVRQHSGYRPRTQKELEDYKIKTLKDYSEVVRQRTHGFSNFLIFNFLFYKTQLFHLHVKWNSLESF